MSSKMYLFTKIWAIFMTVILFTCAGFAGGFYACNRGLLSLPEADSSRSSFGQLLDDMDLGMNDEDFTDAEGTGEEGFVDGTEDGEGEPLLNDGNEESYLPDEDLVPSEDLDDPDILSFGVSDDVEVGDDGGKYRSVEIMYNGDMASNVGEADFTGDDLQEEGNSGGEVTAEVNVPVDENGNFNEQSMLVLKEAIENLYRELLELRDQRETDSEAKDSQQGKVNSGREAKTEEQAPVIGYNDELQSQSGANAGSRAVRCGEYYYFGSQEGIIRTDAEGQNAVRLSSRKDAVNLFRFDQRIYYLNGSDGAIRRIDSDGKEEEIVTGCRVNAFVIDDDHIFYSSEKGIRACEPNGKNDRLLIEDRNVGKLFVLGEWIYYNSGSQIYRSDLSGKTASIVNMKEDGIIDFTMTGEELYILDRENVLHIYLLAEEGQQDPELLTETETEQKKIGVVYKGILYGSDNDKLIAMDLNKESEEIVSKGDAPAVILGTLYFDQDGCIMKKQTTGGKVQCAVSGKVTDRTADESDAESSGSEAAADPEKNAENAGNSGSEKNAGSSGSADDVNPQDGSSDDLSEQ